MSAATAPAGIGRSCGKVVATVGVGKWPELIAVDPRTGMVYVADFGAGQVSVMSGRTRKVTATTIALNPESDRTGSPWTARPT